MFAFGVPVRTVVGVAVTESLVSGVVGTLLGIGAGRLMLTWITTKMMPSIIEDIAIRNTALAPLQCQQSPEREAGDTRTFRQTGTGARRQGFPDSDR